MQEEGKEKARMLDLDSATASGSIIQRGPSHEKPSPRRRPLRPMDEISLFKAILSLEMR